MTRPYISESGPRNNGPTAYANTKMDRVSCASTWLVIPNSALMDVRAGAIIEEDIGETRVKHDTMSVAAHLRFVDPATFVSPHPNKSNVVFPTVFGILWIVV